jgi:hypothetical protein
MRRRNRRSSHRITEPTRRGLEQAARVNDRSLSQEIELRLERSFAVEEAVEKEKNQAHGGAFTHLVATAIGVVMASVEAKTGKSWHKDDSTFHEVEQAVFLLLRAFRPIGPKQGTDSHQGVGSEAAAETLRKQADRFEGKIDEDVAERRRQKALDWFKDRL